MMHLKARAARSICLLLVLLAFQFAPAAGQAFAQPVTSETRVEINLFTKPGCPYCLRAKAFLSEAAQADPGLDVVLHDISASIDAQIRFVETSRLFGIDAPGVPLIVVGRTHFSGYYEAETTGADILAAARQCSARPCPGLDDLLARTSVQNLGDGSEETALPESPAAPPARISVPVLGEIDIASWSLPALTVVLAAIDGFNPCAMWILVFLIGLLVGMQDRARMWILGGAFLLTSGVVYFGFLTAWLNLFLVVGAIWWVRSAVGLVALGSGAIYLRDFLTNRAEECRVTNTGQRVRIMNALKASVGERSFLMALGGIIVLAAAVNLIEFLCSAGIPAVYTQVLAANDLPLANYYGLIGLYVMVFMLDDALIFVTAMLTLAATGMTTRYLRISHLLGGIIMLTIGLLLILAPDLLAFGA